jgi:hypothetical protein
MTFLVDPRGWHDRPEFRRIARNLHLKQGQIIAIFVAVKYALPLVDPRNIANLSTVVEWSPRTIARVLAAFEREGITRCGVITSQWAAFAATEENDAGVPSGLDLPLNRSTLRSRRWRDKLRGLKLSISESGNAGDACDASGTIKGVPGDALATPQSLSPLPKPPDIPGFSALNRALPASVPLRPPGTFPVDETTPNTKKETSASEVGETRTRDGAGQDRFERAHQLQQGMTRKQRMKLGWAMKMLSEAGNRLPSQQFAELIHALPHTLLVEWVCGEAAIPAWAKAHLEAQDPKNRRTPGTPPPRPDPSQREMVMPIENPGERARACG